MPPGDSLVEALHTSPMLCSLWAHDGSKLPMVFWYKVLSVSTSWHAMWATTAGCLLNPLVKEDFHRTWTCDTLPSYLISSVIKATQHPGNSARPWYMTELFLKLWGFPLAGRGGRGPQSLAKGHSTEGQQSSPWCLATWAYTWDQPEDSWESFGLQRDQTSQS